MKIQQGVGDQQYSLLMRQSTSEDALNRRHLILGGLGEGHLVEVRAHGVAQLRPVESPVSIVAASPVLKIVALADGAGSKVSHRLVSDQGDVPLRQDIVS